jgi:AbrB family looped-hinge helix DNA binding protein
MRHTFFHRARQDEEQEMRRKATLTDTGTLTIPPEIRRRLGIEAGDTVVFEVTETGVQLLSEDASDPFERYQGIWREGEGKTLEEIIAEQREMRGWDEYDYWAAENDNRD